MRIPLLSRSSTLGAIVALLLSWVGPTAVHAQFRLSYPFTTSDPLPAGVFLFNGGANGTPGLRNGVLALTEDGQYQEGTIILETLPKQQRITRLRAEFDVRIYGSDPSIADGFSFNFGPAISHAAVGEDGVKTGFAVTFDTYDNGNTDSAPAVEVVYDGKVLSGVTFQGRATSHLPVWPVVPYSLNTGQNFVHVVVEIVPGDTGSVANVWWAGHQILTSVPLPKTYSAPMDWSIAIGARTGLAHSLHYFKNLEITGDSLVQVTAASEYGTGDLRFQPNLGSTWVKAAPVVVQAPKVILLDQFGRQLPDGEEDKAFYQAEPIGFDLNGQYSENVSATVTFTAGSTVTWKHRLTYLAEVHTGTESISGLSPSDITDATHQDELGRSFVDRGAGFDSVVYSSINNDPQNANGARLNAKGYVLENAPGSPERFLQLAGDGDHLRADSTSVPSRLAPGGTFTVEFWARVNPDTASQSQTVLGLGSDAASQLRVYFDTDRSLVLANGDLKTSVPGGWVDDSWHHWALVNDAAAGQVRFYRDGSPIRTNQVSLSSVSTDGTVTIGALAQGTDTATGFFSGGLNNVRLWNGALSRGDIVQSLANPVWGSTRTNLVLEMPFDTVPKLPNTNAVFVEQLIGPGIADYSDLSAFTRLSESAQAGFVLPTPVVPVDPPSNPIQVWQLQARLTWTNSPSEYVVSLNTTNYGEVWFDGRKIVPSENASAPSVMITPGDHLLTVKVQRIPDNDPTGSVLQWALPSGTPTDLPLSSLFLNARGQLGMGWATLVSTDPGQSTFVYRGGDNVVPAYSAASNLIGAVIPGFQLGLAEPGATTQSINAIGQAPMTNWRRVFWGWTKQYKFTASVSSTEPDAVVPVGYLPYFQTDLTTVDGAPKAMGGGASDVLTLWLDEGERLTVGTLYRTPDRRFTLSSLNALTLFSGITLETLVDGVHTNSQSGGASREYTFPAVSGPGSITFTYAKTIHRARLALGEGLDVSSIDTVNAQLVPDLPVGSGPLQITLNAPPSQSVSGASPGPNVGGDGTAAAWDFVGQRWYPTKPGTFQIQWPDQNGYTNTIEVASDFPTEPETRSGFFAFELDTGFRQGMPPQYVYTNTFNPVETRFPGAPAAHYPYALAQEGSYRADLDPSSADSSRLTRMSFTENNSATLTSTRLFTDTVASNRSVVVYSRRTNTLQTATGDLSRETVTVRVIQSRNLSTNASAVVGTKLVSAYDTARLGSGEITTDSKNYNPNIYVANRDVGQWGPLFPVNKYPTENTPNNQPLTVGWYDDPSVTVPGEPRGYIPSMSVTYDSILWPDKDDLSTPVLYISSQMGTEGVGQAVATDGKPNYQEIFDPARVASLAIYNQPASSAIGYNPNEEHAFIAPSKAYTLTGDPRFNLGQSAAFALQNTLNDTLNDSGNKYTSDPFVLVQFAVVGATNASDAFAMRAYAVKTVRNPAGAGSFPATDPTTHTAFDPSGQPVTQPANPKYDFEYATLAGNPVLPPYPLNLVIGNAVLTNTLGGNIVDKDKGNYQRTLWQDRVGNYWAVSGGGQFFLRYWYPYRADFWMKNTPDVGTAVAWVPVQKGNTGTFEPTPAIYDAYWGNTYPVLKKGETLTYAGGEYQADHPSSPGLPALLNWASAEIVFDTATASMILTNSSGQSPMVDFTATSARVTRPLDRLATSAPQAALPQSLQPARSDKVQVVGSRWYFKDLSASLGKRFYYDSLAGQLVFRGRLNGLESGDPNLTRQPTQSYVLEPNFLTEEDIGVLEALPDPLDRDVNWTNLVENLAAQGKTAFTTDPDFGLGIVTTPSSMKNVTVPFYSYDGSQLTDLHVDGVGNVVPVSSLGIGSALVATPHFLQADSSGYLTLAENNDPTATGAVALHVIQLSQERFRGSIQVLTPQDAFSEKINLQHTGDFGGNTATVYYQWWVRDVCPLSEAGTPDAPGQTAWQVYTQGLGLNSIAFTGRPDITLADKFFFVRYGGKDELGTVSDSSWRGVLPDDPAPDWSRPKEKPVPFQWAGAANSPQLQADGSRRYLPQLVMGWVKRVLDQINPYEARYSATFNGNAPATYSSMLQQAGGPYIGPVALNSDKDSLENLGLIQLYETVLQRAKDLTSTPGLATGGTDQAILLAATRLAFLYQLLGSEAFSDAQNSVVPQSADASTALPGDAFAFKNEVANPLQEELALLRGTDFLKAYPTFNRLFWNYFKADGEAFYNANYNIDDANNDGLIDESDAALRYPMGHGDAWGHYLSSLKMHYELLRRPGYGWLAQAELYSLLGNVLPVDYLDEKTLATIAADKVRAGAAILKSTYRNAYVADPAGQWQGYEDTAQPARAWGVSEWSRRVGQGAFFDWLAANAVTPAPSTNVLEGLDRIDRATTVAETASVAAGLVEVQEIVDQSNTGLNPLGLDAEAMAFQTDPYYDGTEWERNPPFKQSLDKAIAAAQNALAAYEFASQADQQLRRIADDTSALKNEALMQDLDYKNRLIAIYGRPYQGTIGSGKIFAEGYDGPDLVTYMYMTVTDPNQFMPLDPDTFVWTQSLKDDVVDVGNGLDFQAPFFGPTTGTKETGNNQNNLVFDGFYLNDNPWGSIILDTSNHPASGSSGDTVLKLKLPITEMSDVAFQAPSDWGSRSAGGSIQSGLAEILASQVELNMALQEYNEYTRKALLKVFYARQKMDALRERFVFTTVNQTALSFLAGIENVLEAVKREVTTTGFTVGEEINAGGVAIPRNIVAVGGDILSAVPGALNYAKLAVTTAVNYASDGLEIAKSLAKLTSKLTELAEGAGKETIAAYSEFLDVLKDLSETLAEEEIQRAKLMAPLRKQNWAGVTSLLAEGERLQKERTALNQQIAAKAQRNRYADLVTRINRTEAMRKYDQALDNALRHAWLAVKTYDYEMSLSSGHPSSVAVLLDEIVKTRSLGDWSGGLPRVGNGGLAGILGRLSANYDALEGQIGLNNRQGEVNLLSLRTEMMRISPASTSDDRWQAALKAARVTDLWQVPEFREYCRPFDAPSGGPQPGIVLRFSTEITPGKNFFGQPLSGLDHAFSPASFATKIRSFTAVFPGYDQASDGSPPQLSVTPRFYLLPVGLDVQRCSDTEFPTIRTWNVVSQRIPVPYPLTAGQLEDPSFQPSMDGRDGRYAERLRFGDSRAFISNLGFTGATEMLQSPLTSGWNSSSRLYGRSVWNTQWLLIVPGSTLSADKDGGLDRFIETVRDIQLYLETYSNQGM